MSCKAAALSSVSSHSVMLAAAVISVDVLSVQPSSNVLDFLHAVNFQYVLMRTDLHLNGI